MAHSKRAFYEACTIEELRIFIKNCATKDSKEDITFWTTRVSKKLCIAKLEELDETEPFRFMDLPVELRLIVYRALFIVQPRYHQILRTSKQVNKEAEDVLYTERAMPVELGGHVSSSGKDSPSLEIGSTQISLELHRGPSALGYCKLFPKSIQKARSVEVTVELSCFEPNPLGNAPATDVKTFRAIAHLFYAFISAPTTGKLEVLDISFWYERMSRASHYQDSDGKPLAAAEANVLLCPLLFLTQKVVLSMSGTEADTNNTFIAEGKVVQGNIKNDLINYIQIKEKISGLNQLVKRTGVSREGIRCLDAVLHSIETREGSSGNQLPDFAFFASRMDPLWDMLQSSLVCKLVQKAQEIENQNRLAGVVEGEEARVISSEI